MNNHILINHSNDTYQLVSYGRDGTVLTKISKKLAKILIAGGMVYGS